MANNLMEYVNKNDPAFLYLNLHPDEEIKLIIRRHWGGFLGTLLLVLGMAIVPIVLAFTLPNILSDDIGAYRIVIVVAMAAFLLFLQTFLFGSWINFYYDIIIITTERMININQEGLLSRDVSELRLSEVQNVTSQQEGILQSFLDYGRLVVETAGEGTTGAPERPGIQGYFTIEDVPQTNRIARAILELSRSVHGHHQEPDKTE
jgi:hypothetical protein